MLYLELGWPRVCVARDGLNLGLLHMGHVLLMLTVSNPCVLLKSFYLFPVYIYW